MAYEERYRFCALLQQIDDLEALAEAQQLLVRSGAFSYCAYQMIARHQAAARDLERLALPDPAPLQRILSKLIQPLHVLLERTGVVEPESPGAPIDGF